MKYYYDLHIHSCLSPCASNDMTPNNIVNMAKLKGLDIVAVTDHNTAKNLKPVLACAKKAGICALAGMEVESAEEIHLLTLFADLQSCLKLEEYISKALPNIKNNTSIFGDQLISDNQDEIIGSVENLLVTATTRTLEQIVSYTNDLGGVCVPAHIDRDSYSIISTFGVMPEHVSFSTVEVSPKGIIKEYGEDSLWLNRYNVISSSDAHYLWGIAERGQFFEMKECSAKAVIEILKQQKN